MRKKLGKSSKKRIDYYPGGMAMPNRNVVGDYRYDFQGQEKDKETGLNAFQLRLYDSRINRWLTTDPYNEFHSPYLAMGNNWVNRIDPDGGKTDDWYEILDADGNGTGEYTWIDGSGYQEGFNHIGFFANVTDAYNNTTFYDGVTQASYSNGKALEYFGGQLDEVLVTADIRSLGKKTSDFSRGLLNPYIRTGSKLGNIIMSQTNVIINEGPHSGGPNDWGNYTFPHYREFDENWNYTKVSLNNSDDFETAIDAVNVTPGLIKVGVPLKYPVYEKALDAATNATVKKIIIKPVEAIHNNQ